MTFSFRIVLPAFVLAVAAASPARGDDYWHFQKQWTAAVRDAHRPLGQALLAAKNELAASAAALSAASAAVNGTQVKAQALEAAKLAYQAAKLKYARAVAAAEGAGLTALVAVASVGAFDVGTGIGQGLGWGISWAWDPILDFDAANSTYHYPSDAEVDAWLPSIIMASTHVPLTQADFAAADMAQPGAGTSAWNFMRENVRGYAIAMRGAAAFTAGRCDDVLAAKSDLESLLAMYPSTVQQFASVLATAQTYREDPRPFEADARAALDELQTYINEAEDPAAMQQAIDGCRAGLTMLDSALITASTPQGGPILLDGTDGALGGLTISQYSQFLSDCAGQGASALPRIEVDAINSLMGTIGISWRGHASVDASIAQWDGLGDRGGEMANFGGGGVLSPSQVLTTGLAGRIARIDLNLSPLVLHCAAAHGTGYEPPLYSGSTSGVSIVGQDGYTNIGAPNLTPFAVYTYAGNTLGIPNNPMGGGAQFAAGVGPALFSNARTEHALAIAPGVWQFSYDLCPHVRGTPVGVISGNFSLQPTTSATFTHVLSYQNSQAVSQMSADYIVYDAAGVRSDIRGLSPGPQWKDIPSERWYHFTTTVDFNQNQITQVSITDLATFVTTVAAPTNWYLNGGAAGGLALPSSYQFFSSGSNQARTVFAVDNFAAAHLSGGPGPGCAVCAADYNNDGGVDGSDVAAFFADWEDASACADVNVDGGIDGADVGFFFALWEQGGC